MYDALPIKEGRIFISHYEPLNVAPKQVNVAQTGRVSIRWTGVQRWDFTLQLEAFGYSNVRLVQSFLNSHVDTPFLISLPLFQSSATSNGVVSTNANVRADTVNLTGFKGTIQAGDFLTFGNSTKLYQARNSLKGSGNLSIFPPLRAPVQASEPCILQGVQICVCLTGDIKQTIDTVDWIASFELEVKEKF